MPEQLLGVSKYDTPLKTFNKRTNNDALQEILDFCQYQEQDLMEAEAILARIVKEARPDALYSHQWSAIKAWLKKREA